MDKQAIEEKTKLLKNKYGEIYTLTVKAEDKEYVGFLRKPTRDEYFAFFSFSSTNPMKGLEIILNSCFLEGDSEILEDDIVFFTALSQVGELIQVYEGDIKKN